MSKQKADIEFTLDGVDYSLVPMTQRTAANVFHNCLSHVLAAVARAVTGSTDAERMGNFAAGLAKVATFDDVWFLLQNLMKSAMINGKEISDLENEEVFSEYPHHMYLVIYHGVKGNWPNYFSKMEAKLSGFASTLKSTLTNMGPGEVEG